MYTLSIAQFFLQLFVCSDIYKVRTTTQTDLTTTDPSLQRKDDWQAGRTRGQPALNRPEFSRNFFQPFTG